jgi:hypothetical protein
MLDEPLVETAAVLARQGVEYVLVGGVAAVLHGAPVLTFDMDILPRRTPENVARLLQALESLDARFRGDPRDLRPNASHLLGAGHALFKTRLGPLDVLGSLAGGVTYDDVVERSIVMTLEGFTVRVLSLPDLIAAKEGAARPKDLAVLPLLRATLTELRRTSGGDPDGSGSQG